MVVFKKNEDIEHELQCELLLAECKANTCDLKEFKEYYAKNVVKKAEALGVELRGVAVANSEWRIYLKLWNEALNVEEEKEEEDYEEEYYSEEMEYVVKTHLHKAMTESSRSEGEGWIVKGVVAKQNGHQIPSCTYGSTKNASWRTKTSTTSTSAITMKSKEKDSSCST